MKKAIVVCLTLLLALVTNAQDQKKFSPEKFEAEMEGYIIKEANLSQQEAARLLPILKEMHARQRTVYKKIRQQSKVKPADEAACAEVIKQCDKMNIELKQIESCYHKKMMQEVSASKAYDVIKAESSFHRKMMTGWQKGNK